MASFQGRDGGCNMTEQDEAQRPASNLAEPPDGGYGWVCVVAVFFINGFTWGLIAVRIEAYAFLHHSTDFLIQVFRCLPFLLSRQQLLPWRYRL